VVKHVHLERVEDRVEALDEAPHPLDVRKFLVALKAKVDILARPEAHHVRIDESGVAEKVAPELHQFVELVLEQHLVDADRAKAAAVLLAKVPGDQADEAGIIRTTKLLEIMAQLARIHLARIEPLNRRRLKTAEAPALVGCLRPFGERGPADEPGVEPRRQGTLAGDLALVIETQAQLVGEVFQRLAWIRQLVLPLRRSSHLARIAST